MIQQCTPYASTQALVKANSRCNGNDQTSTSRGSNTAERISMKLACDYIRPRSHQGSKATPPYFLYGVVAGCAAHYIRVAPRQRGWSRRTRDLPHGLVSQSTTFIFFFRLRQAALSNDSDDQYVSSQGGTSSEYLLGVAIRLLQIYGGQIPQNHYECVNTLKQHSCYQRCFSKRNYGISRHPSQPVKVGCCLTSFSAQIRLY